MASDTLHNANDLIAELEALAVRTDQGSYIKLEDARRLLQKRNEAETVQAAEAPKPKTLVQAREGAKKFLAESLPVAGPREPSKSIPANEPHSPSRA